VGNGRFNKNCPRICKIVGNFAISLKPMPLNLVTLYADLAQNVRASTYEHASVVKRKRNGLEYLYAVSKDGAERTEHYLGPVSDAKAMREAAKIRQAAAQARSMRTTVSVLKQARVPAPTLKLGRVLEVMANAGLFQSGAVLVGTAAFQTYACPLGYYLPHAAAMTNDADLLVASFVAKNDALDLEAILQRADPSFRAKFATTDQLPKVFKSDDGFSVDVLTKYGRGRKSPILFEDLGCSAEALKFMEYLCDEHMEAVALYGAGVLVNVPPPIRYAIHKLLVAQERHGTSLAKKKKDLEQANDLIEIFMAVDSDNLLDHLERARARGRAWKSTINASLIEIGREIQPGKLPAKTSKRKTEA
jgi:hypothetical protein